ncbi:MAG: hypothetical protein QM278_09650 [Pseudomonadota bacterium]|nr:hypothetical protein [Pseudomonadota bacterium]
MPTGFDAPPAACLSLDKKTQDQGPLQAICRMSRLDGGPEEDGRTIDYEDPSKSREGRVLSPSPPLPRRRYPRNDENLVARGW